jgi:hypothetical protein
MHAPRRSLSVLLAFTAAASVSSSQERLAENLGLNTIEPCRVLDTRKSIAGPLLEGETRTFTVVGNVDLTLQGGQSNSGCAIPGFAKGLPQAQAVLLNLTLIPAGQTGKSDLNKPSGSELSLWPSDLQKPKTALLAFPGRGPGFHVANGVVVPLRQDVEGEDISVSVTKEIDLVATVVGYYRAFEPQVTNRPFSAIQAEGVRADGSFDNLTVAGNLTMTASNTKTITGSAGNLTFQETGDSFGSVKMSLQNRFGVNGVLFEQSDVGPIVDFVLKAGAFQRNLRLEGRGGSIQYTTGAGPEFQFGQPTGSGPNLVVADSMALFRRGNVGIGTNSPEQKLHVLGNALFATSGINGVRITPASDSDDGVLNVTDASNSVNWLSVGVNGKVVMNGSGNVGIGTAGPDSKLHVFVSGNTVTAIHGQSSGGSVGIYGQSATGQGVHGGSGSNIGVYGTTGGSSSYGVWGYNTGGTGSATGVYGLGIYGVKGYGTNTGVYAQNGTNTGNQAYLGAGCCAGYFNGDVTVVGTLAKNAGSFKIDHPLDPANKYLYHSFVESPDMMDLYNGVVRLDDKGEATVTLPNWFEALNRDFRYQLTCIGGFAPVYVAEEISSHRFRIAGGTPRLKVSWQVTGIRHDPYADAHRIPVEQDKPAQERGHFQFPELYGQPKDKSITAALFPQEATK